MQEIIMSLDQSLEQRIARIDEAILMLKRNNIPYEKIEHLDKVLTDDARLKEKNEIVRWKLLDLRLVLDSFVIKGFRRAIPGTKRNRDSNPTIPLEVRRLRYG